MKKLTIILLLAVAVTAAAQTGTYDPVARGDSCLEMYDAYHALQYYGEALAADSAAEVRRKVADCHYMRGDYAACVSAMLPVAGPGGDSLSLKRLREMFYSYKNLSDRDRQITWGNAIIRRCPMDVEITAAVAAIYNTDTVYSPLNAKELTERFLQTDSTCIPVLRQYADAEFLLENFGNAASAYRRLVGLGDSTFNTVYSLGMSYMQDSLFEKAKPCLLYAAAKTGMKNAGCLYRLGLVHLELGKAMEAAFYLMMAYQNMQPDGDLVYAVKRAEGEAWYKQENYWSAVYAWREALKRNNTSLATIFNLAQTYGLLGKHEDEKAFYRSFLSLAAQVKKSEALDQWITQAESVVGKLEDIGDEIILPPVN